MKAYLHMETALLNTESISIKIYFVLGSEFGGEVAEKFTVSVKFRCKLQEEKKKKVEWNDCIDSPWESLPQQSSYLRVNSSQRLFNWL